MGGVAPQEVKSIGEVHRTKYKNSLLRGLRPQTPHYHNVKDRYMRHVWPRVGNCHLSVKTTAENPTQCTCGSVCLSFGGIFGGIFVNRRLFSYTVAFLAAFFAALLVAANNL